jgi:hypothetical protein
LSRVTLVLFAHQHAIVACTGLEVTAKGKYHEQRDSAISEQLPWRLHVLTLQSEHQIESSQAVWRGQLPLAM